MVMVVALTVGLSVMVRTITNIRTSNEDENSQRAFSAAEAGVEKSLVTNSSVPATNLDNNTSYSTTISTSSGDKFLANNGAIVLEDDPQDIWLSTYPSYTGQWSGNLTINWGNSSDVCTTSQSTNTQAALEVVLISGSAVSPKLTTYALDPCTPRSSGNNFENVTAAGNVVGGKTFAHKKTIPIASGLIMRIIPLYAPTAIGIEGDVALPSQGTVVTSIGVSDNTQRKIVSFRGYPKLPPEIFPFIIFSPK